MDRERDRETDRETETETERDRDRDRGRDRDRVTHRERHRHRERENGGGRRGEGDLWVSMVITASERKQDVSFVQFMYPVLITSQAEFTQKATLGLCCRVPLLNVRRQLFERNYFPLFVDHTRKGV